MKAVTGVFTAVAPASRAAERLQGLLGRRYAILLTPGTPHAAVRGVPHDEDMPPVGRIFGVSLGAALGLGLGLVLPELLVGAGFLSVPSIVAGIALAVAGGLAGWYFHGRMDDRSFQGLPIEELPIYEDALRQGRSVVVALVKEPRLADEVKSVLEQEGAESLDAARDAWWGWIRTSEEVGYEGGAAAFASEEPAFRRGFEAALRRELRGRSFESAAAELRAAHPGEIDAPAFRRGFERGQLYVSRSREAPAVRPATTPPVTRSRETAAGRAHEAAS